MFWRLWRFCLQGRKILAYSSSRKWVIFSWESVWRLTWEPGAGFAGALYHIINHAFLKQVFPLVGSIPMVTLDIRVLGGLRQSPVSDGYLLIAYAGIGGIPGLTVMSVKHCIMPLWRRLHTEGTLLMWRKKFSCSPVP